MEYHPESYWSEVAQRIDRRPKQNVIAGDDSPFYRYKRAKFLSLFHEIDFTGKKVLEIGSGPGGNLQEVWKEHPAELTGVDISNEMLALARKNGLASDVNLVHIDGETLPFADQSINLVFSVTVLQHNTDELMMESILKEMCRVSGGEVILFERIEKKPKGDALCVGRTIEQYAGICEAAGFRLSKKSFINIQASYIVSGIVRKLFNLPGRKEGERISLLSRIFQRISLPITSIVDKIYKPKRDLAKLVFVRTDS